MLISASLHWLKRNHLPAINISNDFTSMLLAMFKLQVLVDPGDKMVLERALDQLMQKVWGNQFVNISTGKI